MQSANGFHIELTNHCVLKCPECPRTQVIKQFPKFWKNYELSLDDLKNFIDIDITGFQIMLCGNHGDVIYHKDLINIVSWFKQQGSHVIINTNGSYKTRQWWQELCQLFDSNDRIVFSIDGTPNNFTKYRINADWPSILVGIEEAVRSQAETAWKYIVFNYNEHTIDQARAVSNSLGIDHFEIDLSNRFDTDQFRPSEQWVGVKFHTKNRLDHQDNLRISPLCYNGKTNYISADGYYLPCHYASNKKIFYKIPFGKNKEMWDIKSKKFSELAVPMDQFKLTIPSNPMPICSWLCAND